jgi:hypothetical protein
MHIVVGPVLTRKGGYAIDCWTLEEGLRHRYAYGRIEDPHYARARSKSDVAREGVQITRLPAAGQ